MEEKADISKLALLSRLALSENEKESLQKDLNSILGYISQIKEVDVPPLVDTETSFRNQFREDVVISSPDKEREALLGALPEREKDHVLVQKILDTPLS